jgi:hypothetical protein
MRLIYGFIYFSFLFVLQCFVLLIFYSNKRNNYLLAIQFLIISYCYLYNNNNSVDMNFFFSFSS